MSNFLVWFGFSLIIRCLNDLELIINNEALVRIWIAMCAIAILVDVVRLSTFFKKIFNEK